MTVLPPPAPEPKSASPGTSTFPPPTRAQIMRALRAPALGYLGLLLGTIVTMGLVVLAANIGSTSQDTGVDSTDTNAVGVILGMPAQIAAMALLGSLHLAGSSVGFGLFLPPLLLTALYVWLTARTARRLEPIPAGGTRALLAAGVGVCFATLVTPLTWALAMRTQGVSVHAASVSLFFGSWALTGLAVFAGTSRTVAMRRPEWIAADYLDAARLWTSSIALW